MTHDEFGDRMKTLERVYAGKKLPKDLPVCVRLDGKGFSKFTKSMNFVKPFDKIMTSAMQETAFKLMDKTQAIAAYVQSDEISLLFPVDKEIFFDRKISKFNSILASTATGFFINSLLKLGEFNPKFIPVFDCRTWVVPNISEATNTFIWRMQDCERNATSTIYRYTIGKSGMFKKSQSDMKREHEVKFGKSIYEMYSEDEIFGKLYTIVKERHEMDVDIWNKIADKHKPENREYIRNVITSQSVPNFKKISHFDKTCLIYGHG